MGAEWSDRTLRQRYRVACDAGVWFLGKLDIETIKPDIDKIKPDIENLFQPKTARHILKLREAFQGQTIFGRSDVMNVIDIKSSRASDLLKEMAGYGIIEPVSGYGKGKYRFRQQESWDDEAF